MARDFKLGVVSAGLCEWPFQEGLDRVRDIGLSAIEIVCGGFQTDLRYGDPDLLLSDPAAMRRWLQAFQSRDIEISALAIHGRPLSGDPATAAEYDRQFRQTCKLAEAAGVHRLTLFAGLPPGAPDDRAPCWVTTAFPPELGEILEWQWTERVLPYWHEHAPIAADHGCQLCFEMHPGDVVYNPRALLRLRAAVGDVICANLDPSHLFWQGIDPLEAIAELGPAIAHVHAKDTQFHQRQLRTNGVLDPTPHSRARERAWTFRTPGHGHDQLFWLNFATALRGVGYDYVLSIEHEDPFLDTHTALRQAHQLLAPAAAG